VLTLQKAAKLARAGKPAAKPAAADDNEPIHTDPADFRAKRIEAIRLAKSRIDGADRPVVNGRTLPVGVGD
jgi:phosphatidylserine/phosphatidylglycerophosphate/cardiolipin synthase-like enzyme